MQNRPRRIIRPRILAPLTFAAGLFAAGALAVGSEAAAPQAGDAKGRTVWDGVYSAEQATRGEAAYMSNCRSCHGETLGGSNNGGAPSLRGDRFQQDWYEDSLNSLFNRIRRTMPRNAAGSLAEPTYLDIVSYILQVNGFPPGSAELKADAVPAIQVHGKEGPQPVPNFAMIKVVGCLNQGTGDTWTLGSASEPIRTRNPDLSKDGELKDAESRMLGTRTFDLMNPSPSPAPHKGHRMEAKGLLIRAPAGDRLNVISMQMLSESCVK